MDRARASMATLAAITVAASLASVALAAKEKFVRNKPHVNVATIYLNSSDTLSVVLGLVDLAAQLPPTGEVRPPLNCSGIFDVRIVDAANRSAPPLLERADLRVGVNEIATVEFVNGAAGGPRPLDVVVVAREMDGVDGKACILRGAVQATSTATGLVRSFPIRRQDFVTVKSRRR